MTKLFTLLCMLIQQLAWAQGGITWSAPIDIAPASFGNLHPRVGVDGAGNPLVIWGNNNNNKVYFSRWESGGFTLPVALNPASIPVFTASWASPDLAASGDTVYVVYKHTPEDVNHIYLVHSYDGGANFSAPVRAIRTYASQPDFPQCAYGQHVDIPGYQGVVVEIVRGSLKVQSPTGTIRSYNADQLKILYGRA